MVTLNMLRTHEGTQVFSEKKISDFRLHAFETPNKSYNIESTLKRPGEKNLTCDLCPHGDWSNSTSEKKPDLNHLPKKQKDPEEKSDPTRIIWPRSDLINSAFNFFSHHSFLSNDKNCRNYLQIFVSVKKVVIIFQLLFQENSSNEWHFLRWLLKLFQISNEENKEQGMANWKRQDKI